MAPSALPPERVTRHAGASSPPVLSRWRASSRASEWMVVRRAVAVVASAAVVLATGVAWATLRDLTQGITTSSALSGTHAVAPSEDGLVNVLLMGLDSRKDQNGNEGGYNTNTLIVLHIPNNGGAVAAFSVPRDDYVAVHDIPNNDHVKIKEAYGLKKAATEDALGKQGVTDQRTLERAGREAGRRETVQTVQEFLGISIDHFAEVNLAGFHDMALALGGVQVCLNHPVTDSYSGADFPAGLQTLDAAQSLAFVRQRHGLTNGDLDRTHRQQAFLASVTHKLSSAGTFTNVGKLQSLLDVAKRDVVISAGWDIATFIQQATNLTGGNVAFATLPIVRYDTVDGQAVNIVDVPTVQREVKVAFGLEPATPPPTRTAAVAPPLTSTVDVLNGDGGPGLATTVSHALVGAGLTAGRIGGSIIATTMVTYGAGAQPDADAVASLFSGVTASADLALPAGRVSVVLGMGFTPAADLAQRVAALKTPAVPTTATATATATPTPRPQGLPVDGSGIPCVD